MKHEEHVVFTLTFSSSLRTKEVIKLVEAAYDTGFFHSEYGSNSPFIKKKAYLTSLVTDIAKAPRTYNHIHNSPRQVRLVMDVDQYDKMSRILDKVNKSKELMLVSNEIWFDEVVLDTMGADDKWWHTCELANLEGISSCEVATSTHQGYTFRLKLFTNNIGVARVDIELTLADIFNILSGEYKGDDVFKYLHLVDIKLLSMLYGGKKKAIKEVFESFTDGVELKEDGPDLSTFDEVVYQKLLPLYEDNDIAYYSMAAVYLDSGLDVPEEVSSLYAGYLDLHSDERSEVVS